MFVSALEDSDPLHSEFPHVSLEETTTLEQIVSYLSSHSLAPILTEGESEYVHWDFIKDFNGKNSHALGQIIQGDRSYTALFTISHGFSWDDITIELIYLTTDDPIDPLLFTDVVRGAEGFLPMHPSHYRVFIDKQEASVPSTSRMQKWTFFQGQERVDLFVTLTKDGRGGTCFQVTRD